ncbi:MAG: N-acetyltransferase [Flavobacterium sp.]|nr:MAG: N-acetyltransferase [Flavobacterium sp.]
MISDIDTLFAWSNDPETRAASISPDPISYEEHKRWFTAVINSVETNAYIFTVENIASGIVRFQQKNSITYLSYSLSPEVRGLGLSSIMLNLALSEFRLQAQDKSIYGVIDSENKRSQRAFEKVGFNCIENYLEGDRLFKKYLLSPNQTK